MATRVGAKRRRSKIMLWKFPSTSRLRRTEARRLGILSGFSAEWEKDRKKVEQHEMRAFDGSLPSFTTVLDARFLRAGSFMLRLHSWNLSILKILPDACKSDRDGGQCRVSAFCSEGRHDAVIGGKGGKWHQQIERITGMTVNSCKSASVGHEEHFYEDIESDQLN